MGETGSVGAGCLPQDKRWPESFARISPARAQALAYFVGLVELTGESDR